VRFHCADRIAVTAARRPNYAAGLAQTPWRWNRVICELCRARAVPCATVRVISDVADEDLPLDFNAVLSPSSD